MLIVSCLEWLTCLFLFLMVELMKRYYVAPTLPKGYNVQLSNCLTLTWNATPRDGKRHAWWPKCAATSSPRKIGRPVKIAFGDSCGTGDNNFVKCKETFRSDRPKWPDRSKWTTFRAGPEYYGQTKLKWSTNRNFRNFGLKGNKAALDSSLWKILRFTPRLHTAYLPNYFKGTVSRNSAKLGN